MNIKSVILWLVLILVGLGCDDDPVVDRDKFGDYYLVVAEIDSFTNPNWDKYEQFIKIKKMRYLVDLAFDREDSVNFGAENCEVSLSYDDSSYQFKDQGNGLYALTLNYPQQNFTFGKEYRLDITFEDGSHAYSVITTPKITFLEVKDTIYVAPDSVLEWTYVSWGSPYPLTVSSTSFQDSIRIRLTEDGFLISPNTEMSLVYQYIFQNDTANSLWLTYRLKDEHLIILSATASPARFAQKHPIDTINIEFSVEHSAYENLGILSTDDFWPIKNIAEISNITGAYGIFTSGRYNISKKFILKVKE